MLHKVLIGGFLILFHFTWTYSQGNNSFLENLPTQEIDSDYVNLDQYTFSLRTFLVAKSQSFKLKDDDHSIRYTPNNRMGVGIGIAYFPIVLDVAINIKVNKEDASERLDIQGELLYKKSLFGLYIQDYQGFNITGDAIPEGEFRPDIKSLNTGLTYFKMMNSNKMSFRSVFAGGAEQKKSVGSFALGGMVDFYWLRADSSIVPSSQSEYFNDYALIKDMRGFSVSVKGGYSHVFVLPHGFFIFGSVFPGLGISVKKISSIETYVPSDLLNLKLDLQASFGYNSPRIYSTIGSLVHLNNSSLSYSNMMTNRLGRIKWVVGFKF